VSAVSELLSTSAFAWPSLKLMCLSKKEAEKAICINSKLDLHATKYQEEINSTIEQEFRCYIKIKTKQKTPAKQSSIL
jgi:hypothetical protein